MQKMGALSKRGMRDLLQTDFRESPKGEVRRTLIPRNRVHKAPGLLYGRHRLCWGTRVRLMVRRPVAASATLCGLGRLARLLAASREVVAQRDQSGAQLSELALVEPREQGVFYLALGARGAFEVPPTGRG
jgi:hypothetical protein